MSNTLLKLPESPETQAAMLGHLKQMDNEAARAIIVQLEATMSPAAVVLPEKTRQAAAEYWAPTGLMEVENDWLCQWMEVGEKKFSEPFFDETLHKIRRLPSNRRQFPACSSMPFLIAEAQQGESLAPAAFIFHVSRCGSTLLTQLLGTDPKNVVLSEVPVLDGLLRLPHRSPGIEPAMANEAFAAALRLLGRKRMADEQHLFVKTDCWHAFFYDRIRQMFPGTPILLLYRSPDEVLRSQQKIRGIQALPSTLEPSVTGIAPDTFAPGDLDGYFLNLLERIMVRFADIARTDDRAFLVNYLEGPMGMVHQLEKATGIRFPENTRLAMQQRSLFHAKRPGDPFESEPAPSAPSAELQRAFHWYQVLESLRTIEIK